MRTTALKQLNCCRLFTLDWQEEDILFPNQTVPLASTYGFCPLVDRTYYRTYGGAE